MRQYCKCELNRDLGEHDTITAGEAVRSLGDSPAWFALCKKIESMRIGFKPSVAPTAESIGLYAQELGANLACDAFLNLFQEILDEAANARKAE